MTETERLMLKARMALVINQPFFGSLSLRLKMVETTACESAQVDGKKLEYNPDFVRGLTQPQRVGLIAHEVMHCAAGHPMRQGERDHVQFNEAGDFAINGLLLDAGFTLPEGGLVDPAYNGMAAEEIYARRYRKPPPGKPVHDDDQDNPGGPDGQRTDNIGGCGSFKQPSDKAAENRQLAEEWQAATIQAAAIADRAGSLPGDVKEFIEALFQSRVNWIEALKRFVSEPSRQDYSWTPPNRRYVGSGLYLPSLKSEGVGTVVFAIDTSISMNADVLQQALAELNTILSDVEPEKVVVIECDTAVHHVTTFTPAEFPIRAATLHGRGGTAFFPVFEKVAELNLEPACLIYYTDLECSLFGQEPNYPVLWAATQRGNAPFGEVLLVNT